MSVENADNQPPADQSALGTSRKKKRPVLQDKKFMVDIVNKIVSSKVEKLINSYGGKILQSLEKNTDYLISDKMNNKQIQHSSGSEMSNSRGDELTNVPCSKHKNSVDLINEAKLLNTQILSAKQFQHWLKSLLKKNHGSKNPTDQVANVLRGKVSLKIESMDQGQCPVFEFIPKWPDLGDTLCKKRTKIPAQHNFSGDDKSGDEYSSDQYSTSEIGGMCELCDMPFMNYKEHINTKKHMRESQDENKFHELDDLINERPLNVIFNQFLPEKKISEKPNTVLESPSVQKSIVDTIITISDSDSEDNEPKTVPCSFGDKDPSTLKEKQASVSLKRKCCSDTNFRFVPQKRPSNLHSPLHEEISFHKKTKRKHRTYQKLSPKDIYKVEVVNSQCSSSEKDSNGRIESEKPPVIVRFKRVRSSVIRHNSSDVDSPKSTSSDDDCQEIPMEPVPGHRHKSISSDDDDCQEIPIKPIPDYRYIRVVRKPSISDEIDLVTPKGYSKNLVFSFEQPELRPNISDISYYPTFNLTRNPGSSIYYIWEKIANLVNEVKHRRPSSESVKVMSNMAPEQIKKWFYNIPKKIKDDLSFDSSALVSLTELSKPNTYKYFPKKSFNNSTSDGSL